MEGFSSVDLKQEATPKERMYVGVIMVLILFMFARVFYIPKANEIKASKIQIKEFNTQIANLRKVAQLKVPETQQAAVVKQSVIGGVKFEKVVEASTRPKQEVIADVMDMLTANSSLGGLMLNGVSFASESSKDGFLVVPLTVELDGRYAAVMNYLAKMERLERLVTVDNLELTVSKDNPSVVSARISASIYVVLSATELRAIKAATEQAKKEEPPKP